MNLIAEQTHILDDQFGVTRYRAELEVDDEPTTMRVVLGTTGEIEIAMPGGWLVLDDPGLDPGEMLGIARCIPYRTESEVLEDVLGFVFIPKK